MELPESDLSHLAAQTLPLHRAPSSGKKGEHRAHAMRSASQEPSAALAAFLGDPRKPASGASSRGMRGEPEPTLRSPRPAPLSPAVPPAPQGLQVSARLSSNLWVHQRHLEFAPGQVTPK